MRTFTFSEGSSNKFWSIDLQGAGFTVTFGRLGSKGQTQLKSFPTEAAARKEHDKLVAEKLNKGYVEAGAPARHSPLRESLERALDESPDDLASHMAYADLLSEEGDPRGEFIQLQLRLEDKSVPAADRRKLKAREKQLLKRHEREWLGVLAEYVLDDYAADLDDNWSYSDDQFVEHRWRRGLLDRVHVHFLTTRFAQTLADAPAARWLRELVVDEEIDSEMQPDAPASRVKPPRGVTGHTALFELLGSRCLNNLRVFEVGNETGGEAGWADCHSCLPGLEHLIAQMPRVERLILMTKDYDSRKLFGLKSLTNLRELQAEHLEDYPLDVLAKNPALANLTHLWLHPHFSSNDEDEGFGDPGGYLPLAQLHALVRSPHLKKLTHLRFRISSAGDEGVRLLIHSGFLRQLRLLDLRHGCITDAGARLFADYPHLKKLELLDLSRNQLTDEGIALLDATGANVRCDDQHPVGSHEYLTEGDFE